MNPSLDLLVIIAYLATSLGVGWWLSGRSRDAHEFFRGGGSVPTWAILISIVATETSALTFLSVPGLAYMGNLSFAQIGLGYIIGRMIVARYLLPHYARAGTLSVYEYVGTRFGPGLRRACAGLFVITRALSDSVRLFATALPVALLFGTWLPGGDPLTQARAAIVVMGGITLLYTWRGGMRAVVFTDVLQAAVYLMGALCVAVVLGDRIPGGWGAIWEQARASGHAQLFDFSWRASEPYTFWASVVGGAFLSMGSHGVDQLLVLRALGARDLKQARRALVGSGWVVTAQILLFLLLGLGLHAFYQGRAFERGDEVFADFVVHHLPPGLAGLIVAAVLAAAMSTISGSLQSLASSTLADLLPARFATDRGALRAARILTVAWCVVLVGIALLFGDLRTPVVQVALSIASVAYGALLALYATGLWLGRATAAHAAIAMAVALGVGVISSLHAPWAWTWTLPVSAASGLLTALCASSFSRRP